MSLVENMNARKKAGTSRSKKNSTVSPKAYKNMKDGWPNSKKKKAKKKRVTSVYPEWRKSWTSYPKQ